MNTDVCILNVSQKAFISTSSQDDSGPAPFSASSSFCWVFSSHIVPVRVLQVLLTKDSKSLVVQNNESLFSLTQGQLGISSHRDTGFQNINHLENYLVGNHILGSSSIVPEIIYIYNFCSYIFGQGKLKVASNFQRSRRILPSSWKWKGLEYLLIVLIITRELLAGHRVLGSCSFSHSQHSCPLSKGHYAKFLYSKKTRLKVQDHWMVCDSLFISREMTVIDRLYQAWVWLLLI